MSENLIPLIEDADSKRQRFRMLGMMNVPTDPEKRREAAIAYEMAHRDVIAAENALERAKRESAAR